MIVVIGEILIDVFETYQRIGGAPFNFAFHLKKLGWPVRLLTRIGDDAPGNNIFDLLKKQSFNMEDVQIDTHHPTGTVQVSLNKKGVPQFDIRTGVAYDYLDESIADSIDWPSVQMVYIGTLAQRTEENYTRIQHIINSRQPKTIVFFDINLRSPHVNTAAVKMSLQQSDILKLNSDELAIIQNLVNEPETSGSMISSIMKRFSLEMVVLTRGSDGSSIYTKDNREVTAPLYKNTHIVDTVGAGDAYAAVVAAGYLKGLPAEAIVEKASNFAAYVCTLKGAVPEETAVYQTLRKQLGGTFHGT